MLNLHKFNNLIPQVRVSPILEINDSLDNLLHRVLVKRKILVIGGAGSIGASTLLKILSYVPSVVFPSIIFPGILLDDYGTLVTIADPKIYGALIAIIVGYFSKNVILTIVSGLTSYWFLIFVF